MPSSRSLCYCVLAFFSTLPVASQSRISPHAAFGALDPDGSSGITVTATQSKSVEPVPQQLGDQLMQQGRYQAAIEEYQLVPIPSAKLWSSMGIAYQFLSDFHDALRCYRESLKLNPKNARVINNLATDYDQLGDYRRAERLYREAIRIDPHFAVYFKNLGTNLLAQHEVDKGSEAYRQALSIKPHILDLRKAPAIALPRKDNAETNYVKARSCAQAGLIDCTLVYLRKALSEGSATPKEIASDSQFQAVLNTPEMRQLLAEQR